MTDGAVDGTAGGPAGDGRRGAGRRWRAAGIVPARQVWLAAGVAALTLWAMLWYLCTPAVIDRVTGDAGYAPESGGGMLSALLSSWSREGPLLMDVVPTGEGAGVMSARVVVLTLLFALAVGWAVRAVPPTARRWPWTLLLCSALSVGCAMAATMLVALVQPVQEEWWDRGLVVASSTGMGAPLLLLFGPVAAGAGLVAGALGREAPPAAPEGVPPSEPLPRRLSLRAAGAVAGTLVLMIAAFGHPSAIDWLSHPEDGGARISWGLLRWLVPGAWSLDAEVVVLAAADGGVTVLGGLVQALLAGALFWLLQRQLHRRTLPALMMTGAVASLVATVAVQLPILVFSVGIHRAEPVFYLHYGLWYGPGGITAGLAGGLAAGLLLRWWLSRPAPDEDTPAPGGSDGETDDELVITLSR